LSRASLLRISNQITGLRFLTDYARYVRRPITRRQAGACIAERLQNREGLFLDMLRRQVFANPASPYLPLLRYAGCQLGDIESGVQREGLEAMLHLLFRNGVYLTSAEFKGRTRARRNQVEVEVGPDRLRSLQCSYHLSVASSGSSGEPTPVLMDLRFLHACAGAWQMVLGTWGERDWAIAVWETPSAGAGGGVVCRDREATARAVSANHGQLGGGSVPLRHGPGDRHLRGPNPHDGRTHHAGADEDGPPIRLRGNRPLWQH
jgi:hypothetical protein